MKTMTTQTTRKISTQAWTLAAVLAMVLAGQAQGQQAKDKAAPAVEAAKPAAKQAPKLVPAKQAPAGSAEEAPVAPTKTDQATDAPGEEGQQGEGQSEKYPPKGPGGLFGSSSFLYIMLGMLVLMFLFSSRSKKKQANKRRELLESIRKGSKIVTIGGIVGTVAEVRDDEVLVKVDDGTRMKFARWAIRTVGDDAESDKGSDTQEQR